jgi:hypothetical protein
MLLLLLLLHTKSSQLLVLSDGPSVLLRLLLLLPPELSPANDARTAPQPPSLLLWLLTAPAPLPPLLLPVQEPPSYDSRNSVTLPAGCGVGGIALPCSSLETW